MRCGLRRFNSHYILLKRQFSEYFVNALKKNDKKHFQDSCENLKTLKRQDPDIQYVCRSPEFFFYNLNKSQLNKP